MVLEMAAAVAKPTTEYLEQALANVKTSDLGKWCHDRLGISVQAQRQRAYACAVAGSGTNHDKNGPKIFGSPA